MNRHKLQRQITKRQATRRRPQRPTRITLEEAMKSLIWFHAENPSRLQAWLGQYESLRLAMLSEIHRLCRKRAA